MANKTPKLADLNASILALTAQVESMNHELRENKKKLDEQKTGIDKLVQKYERLESENNAKTVKINQLETQIKELQSENSDINKHLIEQSLKIDDLEQYSKRDNIVIYGLHPKFKSFATVTKEDDLPDENKNEEQVQLDTGEEISPEKKVINFLTEHVTKIEESDIEACHALKARRAGNTHESIVVKLKSRKTKFRIMSNLQKLRAINQIVTIGRVYINDYLTRRNNELMFIARKLFKQKKGSNYVRNGRSYIKTKGNTNEETRTVIIRDKSDFEDLGLSISD